MRRRILTSAAVVVLAGALLMVILLAWRSASGTSATLSDGVVVRFVGVALGSAQFTREEAWRRTARRIFPRSLQGWISKARAVSCSSSTNGMTIYLEQFDTSGAITTAKAWAFHGAEDENGTRLQMDGGYCSFGPDLLAVTLRTWPRRQSHFRLNFMDGNGKVLGGLRVANPVKGPFPVWSSQSLPQTRTNGPVVLTLQSVRENRANSPWSAAVPSWRIHSTDPQWQAAEIRSFTFRDATGNEGQWLPRSEPAWKAEAFVYRKGMDDFLPAERMVVEGVAIPKTAEFTALDQTIARGDVKIILHVVAAAGRLYITNGLQRAMIPPARGESGHSTSSNGQVRTESWGSEQPFLLFEVQGQQDNDVIDLILRDDQGIILKTDDSSGYSSSGTGRTYLRRFTAPAEAKSISIEMAVNRPLPFEFIFDPAELRTPLPPE